MGENGGKSKKRFPASTWLQNYVMIQPRTSLSKWISQIFQQYSRERGPRTSLVRKRHAMYWCTAAAGSVLVWATPRLAQLQKMLRWSYRTENGYFAGRQIRSHYTNIFLHISYRNWWEIENVSALCALFCNAKNTFWERSKEKWRFRRKNTCSHGSNICVKNTLVI